MKYLFFISLFLISTFLFSEKLNIGVFTGNKISKIEVKVQRGGYSVYGETGKLIDNLLVDSHLTIELINGVLVLNHNGKRMNQMGQISLIALVPESNFLLSPSYLKPRPYKDNLFVRINSFYDNRLLLINNVSLTNYLEGVIRSEVGTSPSKEYYRLQSVICRTYAKKNFERHFDEGYQLCDRTHCQAYYKQNNYKLIAEAVAETKNQVVVDLNANYIQATFFSNCGGQTELSENVWVKKIMYNKSVLVTFCMNTYNATWKKTFPIDRWKKYLAANDVPKSIRSSEAVVNFTQEVRQKYLTLGQISIKLADIRKDLKLKSTFFSIHQEDNKAVFTGRGFGHGVGLCQEGAILRAKSGQDYLSILGFYFKDVNVIDYRLLDYYQSN